MAKPPTSRQLGPVCRLVACALCALPLVATGCSTTVAPAEPPILAREPVPTFTPLVALKSVQNERPPSASPTAAATATIFVPPTPTPIVYTVQRGDTLGALAVHFGISLEQLMAANGITDAGALKTGQQLTIPVVAAPSDGPATAEAPASATAESGEADLSGSGGSNLIHYVRVGETLSVIANIYDVQLKDLLRANGLAPDSQLTAGDTLLIPRGVYTPIPTVTPVIPEDTPTPKPTATGPAIAAVPETPTVEPTLTLTPVPTPLVYEVRRGDVPAAIAQRYGVRVDSLLAANPGVAPSLLRPGDKLVIPGTSAAPPTATPILPTSTPDRTVFTEHTITAGETITDLYVRYNLTYDRLVAYNTITDSNHLPVGSVLRIALGTPTPTATVIPSPTVSPTPLPVYLAPVPLMPLNGADLGSTGQPIVLSWAATGLLGPNEYYVVRLRTYDSSGTLVASTEAWTQTTSWRVPDEARPPLPGSYVLRWDVSVRRRLVSVAREATGMALSSRSPAFEFRLTVARR
ncbi:MAG: LysM peptidoglycan-binding domain-containing protein [Ardenticatenaceae bacterium]|nr:LysM peptidoglycan-binding domain-containing protein [Ardenticatenaceae bacterium]